MNFEQCLLHASHYPGFCYKQHVQSISFHQFVQRFKLTCNEKITQHLIAVYSYSLTHPRVTTVACKRPQSFHQKCNWQVNLNMNKSLMQRSRSGLTMPLCRHSVGSYQKTSSLPARRGTLGRSHLSSLNHCGLILA